MFQQFSEFLAMNITGSGSGVIIGVILLTGIALAAVIGYFLTKWTLELFEKLISRTKTKWDDDLLNPLMLRAISQLTPAIVVNWLLPGLFGTSVSAIKWLTALTSLYILWAAVRIVTIFFDNLYNAFLHRRRFRAYAVKGIFDTFKLIAICIGVIVGLSIIIGKSPVVIITALGASAAVLLLIFQDSILGLVASVQFTANKLMTRGDWIEDKSHDINGEVIEVSLTAVKVRNWDNSVSTVHPYALMKGSFRNYQPMRRSGGRRVDRSIFIDLNTVRFLTADELTPLRDEGFITDEEMSARQVNLKLLRSYLERYLVNHDNVRHDMTTMVRQLEPTPSGLPLQLYFFVDNVAWEAYEALASDIFDHVYAVVSLFGLHMFQIPAGTDLSRVAR